MQGTHRIAAVDVDLHGLEYAEAVQSAVHALQRLKHLFECARRSHLFQFPRHDISLGPLDALQRHG